MNADTLRQIEKTHLEYKLSLETGKPKSWLKSISAFANTQGGHILFGVTNGTHELIGLENAQQAASKIAELISTRIDPHVQYELTEFKSNSTGRNCLDLEIFSGPSYPYYYKHEQTREAYVRRGDRSEPATSLELNNLILRGKNMTYDALSSGIPLDNVSFTLLGATYMRVTGEPFSGSKDLPSMGLVDKQGIVTNAGALLCDQGLLKQSRIVCTQWKGTAKGYLEEDALDDQEYMDSSLLTLLSNAEAFVQNHSRRSWNVRGLQREERSAYPARAVREALVNALIHRDYQNVGSEIHIDIFDDRMEIMSPGGMVNGSRIQECNLYKVPSIRRNEIISDVFGRLHYMDRRGSGLGRILGSYAGTIKQPEFYSDGYLFLVTLPDIHDTFSKKISLSNEKASLFPKKVSLSGEEVSLFPDEAERPKAAFPQIDKKAFRAKSVATLSALFEKYGFTKGFTRRAVVETCCISTQSASRLLRKALTLGIFVKEKRGLYFFARTN